RRADGLRHVQGALARDRDRRRAARREERRQASREAGQGRRVKVKLLYFASHADRAGCSEEIRETVAAHPRDLYREVSRAHAFALAPERVRVAVNGALTDWERKLADGDEVVFLPPVSGG